MVIPSAVLNMALGVTGQALTQGALEQWLQSTGRAVKEAFGNFPSSR
jgi:hypothetical protein